MLFDRIRVDAVVDLGELAVQVPGEGEALALILLQALEFLDEVQPELDGDPGRELEGDVLMSVGATISTST
jgi:hypothetical protein